MAKNWISKLSPNIQMKTLIKKQDEAHEPECSHIC